MCVVNNLHKIVSLKKTPKKRKKKSDFKLKYQIKLISIIDFFFLYRNLNLNLIINLTQINL